MIEDSTVRLMIKCVTHVPIPQKDTDTAGLLLAAGLAAFHTVLVSSPPSIDLISRAAASHRIYLSTVFSVKCQESRMTVHLISPQHIQTACFVQPTVGNTKVLYLLS